MMLRALALAVALFAAAGASAAPASSHRRDPYVGAITADAASGRVITADHETEEAYPASVTKLMTAFLVLEDIAAGRYSFTNMVVATPAVYMSEASWVGLKAGERMSVRDLLYAMLVESANDAAIALGVNSAGSFDAFVAKMNARAAELGMTRTRYYNPNGLPPNPARRYPWKNFNVSTAADQLRTPYGYRVNVTRAVNRPQRETRLAHGETIVKTLKNHNRIMREDKLKLFNPDGSEAVDGLKTGFIKAGGSSIVLTGTRGGKRAVVVVLGSASADIREANAKRLLADALGTLVW